MRVRLLVAGALAGLLATAGTAGAKQPPGGAPQPLPPAQAAALAGAPSVVSSSSATRAVTAQEALAAGSLPGAAVSVAAGLSLEQAVGLAPAGTGTANAVPAPQAGSRTAAFGVAAAAATGCAANVASWHWGTWPYDQSISDTTYWCAVYGDHITYRSSSVNAGGTLCGTNSMGSALISGGIGYSWFVTRSSAVFSCPTVVPWVTLHPSHYLDVSRNAWGNSAIVGSG